MKWFHESAQLWRWIGLSFVLAFLVLHGCSKQTESEGGSNEAQTKLQSSLGTIVGKAQVALKSGEVRSVAFATLKLVQQPFQVLSESEKEAISYDADHGLEAARLGIASRDEVHRKIEAKTSAMESLQRRLPEKQAISAVATATTDANGSFKIERINPGTYWLFLDVQISGNLVGWAQKVELKAGKTVSVDLNNTNVEYTFR